MISKTKPQDFNPLFEAVGCLLVYDGKILLLRRTNYKNEGGKWGHPGGKVEKTDKDLVFAVLRELNEETGLNLSGASVNYLGKAYVKYPEFDFVYHVFRHDLSHLPDIKIDKKEHSECAWKTPAEARAIDLMQDEGECIEMFFRAHN